MQTLLEKGAGPPSSLERELAKRRQCNGEADFTPDSTPRRTWNVEQDLHDWKTNASVRKLKARLVERIATPRQTTDASELARLNLDLVSKAKSAEEQSNQDRCFVREAASRAAAMALRASGRANVAVGSAAAQCQAWGIVQAAAHRAAACAAVEAAAFAATLLVTATEILVATAARSASFVAVSAKIAAQSAVCKATISLVQAIAKNAAHVTQHRAMKAVAKAAAAAQQKRLHATFSARVVACAAAHAACELTGKAFFAAHGAARTKAVAVAETTTAEALTATESFAEAAQKTVLKIAHEQALVAATGAVEASIMAEAGAAVAASAAFAASAAVSAAVSSGDSAEQIAVNAVAAACKAATRDTGLCSSGRSATKKWLNDTDNTAAVADAVTAIRFATPCASAARSRLDTPQSTELRVRCSKCEQLIRMDLMEFHGETCSVSVELNNLLTPSSQLNRPAAKLARELGGVSKLFTPSQLGPVTPQVAKPIVHQSHLGNENALSNAARRNGANNGTENEFGKMLGRWLPRRMQKSARTNTKRAPLSTLSSASNVTANQSVTAAAKRPQVLSAGFRPRFAGATSAAVMNVGNSYNGMLHLGKPQAKDAQPHAKDPELKYHFHELQELQNLKLQLQQKQQQKELLQQQQREDEASSAEPDASNDKKRRRQSTSNQGSPVQAPLVLNCNTSEVEIQLNRPPMEANGTASAEQGYSQVLHEHYLAEHPEDEYSEEQQGDQQDEHQHEQQEADFNLRTPLSRIDTPTTPGARLIPTAAGAPVPPGDDSPWDGTSVSISKFTPVSMASHYARARANSASSVRSNGSAGGMGSMSSMSSVSSTSSTSSRMREMLGLWRDPTSACKNEEQGSAEEQSQSEEVTRLQRMVADMSSQLNHLKQQVVVRECAEDCSATITSSTATTWASASNGPGVAECPPQFMRCRECHCMVDLNLIEEHGLVCFTAGEEPEV
jgi:hypothetical protein